MNGKKWHRIEDQYHEELTREQCDCEIHQTNVFKRHDILTEMLKSSGNGSNQVLHTDVEMQIATDYNLFVLIGNMSSKDNYVLFVGNQRVTLIPGQAIIMKASCLSRRYRSCACDATVYSVRIY